MISTNFVCHIVICVWNNSSVCVSEYASVKLHRRCQRTAFGIKNASQFQPQFSDWNYLCSLYEMFFPKKSLSFCLCLQVETKYWCDWPEVFSPRLYNSHVWGEGPLGGARIEISRKKWGIKNSSTEVHQEHGCVLCCSFHSRFKKLNFCKV